MTAAFDTLAAARDMENAGLKREAAEAVASAIRAGQGELATGADIAALRSDMTALEARLQAMLWRAMLLQGFAIVGAVVALLKWLP